MASTTDTESVLTSDILIHNLHCGSCVRTIEKILSSLSPPPVSFRVSIVSRSLTVHHLNVLSKQFILAALEDSGFDTFKSSPDPRDNSFAENVTRSEKRSKNIQLCLWCANDSSSSAKSKFVAYSSDSKPEEPLHVTENPLTGTCDLAPPPDGPVRVMLSVGGMTCSSCSHTITNALSELSGVSEVVVSLLDQSATAVAKHRGLVDDMVGAVEDCGFEAHVFDVEEINPQPVQVSRTVALRVDGMFCP